MKTKSYLILVKYIFKFISKIKIWVIVKFCFFNLQNTKIITLIIIYYYSYFEKYK